MTRLLIASAALALTAPAFAGINATFYWVQVDNTVFGPELDPINGPAWIVNDWFTIDLFVQGDFTVNGVNLGSAQGEDHLGLRFNTPAPSNDPVEVFNTSGFPASDFELATQQFFSASRYDTYVTLGDNNAGGAAPNELLSIALNGLTMDDGVLRGAWAHNPVYGGTPQDATDGIRLLRLSFDPDDVFVPLGSPLFTGLMEIGTPEGVFTVAIPAPGAAGVLALSALAATRRRR